jgi:hypothetical protein
VTDGPDEISFTGRACPGRFRLRTLTLQPADAIAFLPADWADAVVVVERGVLEIECRSGRRAVFAAGAVLVFDGLDLRRLRSNGTTPLVLSALSRPGVQVRHER